MAKEETTKHTMHFFAGDIARLQELYPDFGASLIVRQLVRKHLEAIDSQAKEAPDNIKEFTL